MLHRPGRTPRDSAWHAVWPALVALAVVVLAGNTAVHLLRPTALPPAPVATVLPVTAPAAAPVPRALAAAPAVPDKYRGQVVRQRLRRFPYKLLALTFDDGPSASITPQVLRLLEAHQARATFFVMGRSVRAHPEILRQAARAGHAIGAHSYSHPSSTTAAQAGVEMERTAALIEQATGQAPTLFRPPYGITTGNLCRLALRQKYAVILWTISSADSNSIGAATIAKNVIHTPNPGEIILAHDAAAKRATLAALPQILTELTAAGFRFVTVPELLRAWDEWEQKQKGPQHAQR